MVTTTASSATMFQKDILNTVRLCHLWEGLFFQAFAREPNKKGGGDPANRAKLCVTVGKGGGIATVCVDPVIR